MGRAQQSILGFAAVISVTLALERNEQDLKKRELYEIAQENWKVGLDPFFEGNMEPWGVVVVAYVKMGSDNHKTMKQIASQTAESDEELFDLQVPTAAALNWQPEESLEIIKRDYAKVLWDSLNTSHLDAAPIVFPSKPGKPWKFKEVRQWLLDNSFPTLNYRIHGYQNKKITFPFNKYFGKANAHGVGLILADLGKEFEFEVQFRVARALKPYLDELYEKKIYGAYVEKTKGTLSMRKALKMGLDDAHKIEFILIENAGQTRDDVPVDNFNHGNPKKYRLTNFSEVAVKEFFDGWRAGTLPTYWGSTEESGKMVGTKLAKRPFGNLTSWNFEDFLYGKDMNNSHGVLVAFWNSMDRHGCKDCKAHMKVWNEVAKEVQGTKALKRMVIASIDQSLNEHSENLVPGKPEKPMIVWYPPGTPAQRRKRKQTRESMGTFTKDFIMEHVTDLLETIEDDEREEL